MTEKTKDTEEAKVTEGNIGITEIEVNLGTEGVRGLKRTKGLSTIGFIDGDICSVLQSDDIEYIILKSERNAAILKLMMTSDYNINNTCFYPCMKNKDM
jgi:hypothetical protein